MSNLKVAYMGGKQAGCIGLLALGAGGYAPKAVVAYDQLVKSLAESLNIAVFPSIGESGFKEALSAADILVSVHGREIVPKNVLETPPLGGINVHPCLYSYKGANPVGRLLQDGNSTASVGVHRMTERVDEGEVLVEEFIQVADKKTVDEVYNALYPFYATMLLKALKIMGQRLEATD